MPTEMRPWRSPGRIPAVMRRSCRWLVALCLACSAFAAPALAAESYDNCTGRIQALPAVINVQGVWCLDRNLSTAMAFGNAIDIQANNVTIDCNGFKVGGLAAGDASQAVGIHSEERSNITVRGCGLRGFHTAILLVGGSGHLVEHNLLDENLGTGIWSNGSSSLVRRNRVYNTGGAPGVETPTGISAVGDLIENTIDGVHGIETNTWPYGIKAGQIGAQVQGNLVRGLVPSGTGFATGIRMGAWDILAADNRVSSGTAVPGFGIRGYDGETFCRGNTVALYATAFDACRDSGGNASF